ncbi:MAG: hypothetical protein H7318_09595 [Oligoflexus sp.]|nr:hypothetical protein [Oligoflexus sp.]
MNQVELLKRFRDFTDASLIWCVKEAELGTSRVTGAIDGLLKDIARVSAMSNDSLKALEGLQSMLKSFDNSNYQQLHKSLQSLSLEHSEIDRYIQPIMEALQFQDRFRQNLENVVKMIDVWQEQRKLLGKDGSEGDQLLNFGKALIARTTMKRERDVIRAHIKGLAPEAEVDRVNMF